MKVRALRGVCIGPGRNLAIGEETEIDKADVQFLVSIGAVEVVTAPVAAAAPSVPTPAAQAPAQAEKPAKPAGGVFSRKEK